MENDTPASKLEGMVLAGTWKVLKRLTRPKGATGGRFSIGYIVENVNDQRQGYLKAIDYLKVFRQFRGQRDLVDVMAFINSAFQYERNILYRCKEQKLTKVILAIDDGQYDEGTDIPVPYLIFEKADRDSREQLAIIDEFDYVWRFRALHDNHLLSRPDRLNGSKPDQALNGGCICFC